MFTAYRISNLVIWNWIIGRCVNRYTIKARLHEGAEQVPGRAAVQVQHRKALSIVLAVAPLLQAGRDDFLLENSFHNETNVSRGI